MPNYDGGRYFLTVLAPVKSGVPAESGPVRRSHAQLLRDTLARMPTAKRKIPAALDGGIKWVNSPFARSERTHLARFAVIDDLTFNGRMPSDAIRDGMGKGGRRLIPQHVDHLSQPYLLFAADVDAATTDESALEIYLDELWQVMELDLRAIFGHCVGFEGVSDSGSFIYFIKRCQVETTMPFNDYWEGPPPLKDFPAKRLFPVLKVLAVLAVVGLLAPWVIDYFAASLDWSAGVKLAASLTLLAGAVLLAIIAALLTYVAVMRVGNKPFPAAPDSELKDVLKALYLQQKYTEFAIQNQESDDATLHANFGQFIKDHHPDNADGPTQEPGVIRS